jgi:hypothetical protein
MVMTFVAGVVETTPAAVDAAEDAKRIPKHNPKLSNFPLIRERPIEDLPIKLSVFCLYII